MTTYNWDQIPKEFKWVATDKGGLITAFVNEPHIDTDVSTWDIYSGGYMTIGTFPSVINQDVMVQGDATFWETSLEERPKPKPRYGVTRSEYPEPTVMYDRLTEKHLTIHEVERILNQYDKERAE